MPQQLIYTSAPRGLVPGRSGYCTVARTASMREPLVLRLEQLSYYQHVSLAGGRERPICACRVVDIRGARFHVLSRIQDAGLDFTGRTNFIAHHLVVTPEEIGQLPVPALILRDWPGWVKSWAEEPRMLATEDWAGLNGLASRTSLPATQWERVTGDAVNGYSLLEAKSGLTFGASGLEDDVVLSLLAESAELLEVKDTRRDYRAAAWQYTFTTSLQEQDNPADFRWRILHSDSPGIARLGGADCPGLASLRAPRCAEAEVALARSGKKPPSFRIEPQDVQVAEGSPAKLQARAEGIPTPSYQWYSVDRAEKLQLLPGETSPELVLRTPPVGVSRYKVTAINSAGESSSRVIVLSVDPRMRLQRDMRTAAIPNPPQSDAPYIQSEEKIEQQRNRLLAQKAEEVFHRKRRRSRIAAVLCLLAIAAFPVAWVVLRKNGSVIGTSRIDPTNAISHTNTLIVPRATRDESKSALSLASAATTNETILSQPSTVHQPLAESDNVALPVPWKAAKIGNVYRPSASVTKEVFTVVGAAIGARDTNDNIFFILQPASNSVTFTVHLAKVERASTASNCGIMMRASVEDNAPFVFLGPSSATNFWMHRDAVGQTVKSGRYPGPREGVYLRLIRDGSRFLEQISSDGDKWDWMRECTDTNISETNYVLGFAIWSGNTDNPVKARFDKVIVSPTEPAR
jgi:hypothetical protein